MTRIRRVDSYKNPYLPISKLSHMNAYGSDPVDAINRVDPVPPMNNELTQVNKYMDIREDGESNRAETRSDSSTGETQTVSELARNHGSLHSKKGFETVTMNLERYEQMRQDVERLKQLEEELSRMMKYVTTPPALEGTRGEGEEGYSIQINKKELKKFMNQRISENEDNKGQIRITNIDFE